MELQSGGGDMEPERKITWRASLADFTAKTLILLGLVAAALLLWQWREVLLLLFASIVIACGVTGLASPIRKYTPLKGGWAVGGALLIIATVLGGIFWLLGSQLTEQFRLLIESVPEAVTNLRERLDGTPFDGLVPADLELGAAANGVFSSYAGQAMRLGASISSGALNALIVIVASMFLALSPEVYRDGALMLVPRSVRPNARHAFNLCGAALRKWLLATLFSVAVMTVLVSAGLWALRVPAPLALGLLSGLAQFIPFIGTLLTSVVAALLALTVNMNTALWTLLLYFVASTIEANILYPLVQKRAIDQPPVITLFTVIAFGLLFGAMGVFLAVPLTVVLTIFLVIFYIRGGLGEDKLAPGEDEAQQQPPRLQA